MRAPQTTTISIANLTRSSSQRRTFSCGPVSFFNSTDIFRVVARFSRPTSTRIRRRRTKKRIEMYKPHGEVGHNQQRPHLGNESQQDRANEKDEYAIVQDYRDVQRNALVQDLISRVFAPTAASEFASANNEPDHSQSERQKPLRRQSYRGSRDEVDGSAFADLIDLREDGRHRFRQRLVAVCHEQPVAGSADQASKGQSRNHDHRSGHVPEPHLPWYGRLLFRPATA